MQIEGIIPLFLTVLKRISFSSVLFCKPSGFDGKESPVSQIIAGARELAAAEEAELERRWSMQNQRLMADVPHISIKYMRDSSSKQAWYICLMNP